VTTLGAVLAAELARYIPQHLWHDWIVRFQPQGGVHVDALATDIPIALLLPRKPDPQQPQLPLVDAFDPAAGPADPAPGHL
jgi:hypothetical protein